MTSEQWIAIEEVYAAILADAGVGLAAAFPAEHLHPRERQWRDPHSRRALTCTGYRQAHDEAARPAIGRSR
ncbi:MAG TPA: hypothetical protein VKF37_18350 [Chloroflexota bacterium]|jgi:hypothetical protein|nr:hypothetical protein [Chloroflexota bacterium]